MWFFSSPRIVFGEDALSYLESLSGQRAFIITDEVMLQIGHLALVEKGLKAARLRTAVFTGVRPDPDLPSVERCAEAMAEFQPDWIIGLGGGSAMDTAKAAWFRYERPDVPLEAVNPIENFGLRSKARLIAIPTTAGSGAEVTSAAVIIDPAGQRKLEIPSFEMLPDVAIIDPLLSSSMPPALTADTGIDVLTHAIEGYSSSWSNDFSDGLSIQAARLVFQYLPRAVKHASGGPADPEAREKMAIAAALGGLSINTSHIALAHCLGHSAGALLELPHGRVTGLCLPYAIEFTARGGVGRYLGLALALDLPAEDELRAGLALARSVRDLLARLNLPRSLSEAGISQARFRQNHTALAERAQMDSAIATTRRIPDYDQMLRLYENIYRGLPVDF